MMFLDAQIWTRGGGWPGASFCGRGLFRDNPKGANCASSEISKKANHRTAVTPSYDVFRCSKLDTGGRVARRIFLREEVVQGRSKIRQLHVSVNFKKRQKKANYGIDRNSIV